MALPQGPASRVDLENASLLALFRQEFGDAEVISRLAQEGTPVRPLEVHRLFSGIRGWAKAVASAEPNSCFLIVVDWSEPTSGTGPVLYRQEPATVGASTAASMFTIASDGTVVATGVHNDVAEVQQIRNLAPASGVSKDLTTTVFHYHAQAYTVFDCGSIVESNVDVLGQRFPHNRLSAYYRPIAQWDDLLKEHFVECVRDATQTKHWHNKSLRILRGAPEDIFKGSLWWYLNTFTLDALKVKQEYPVDGGGNKPVDVCVILNNGEEYLFEVKWMGKAQAGAAQADGNLVDKYYPMDEKAALAGKEQVINYLASSQMATLGCCVVYDAREEDTEPDWSLCNTDERAHHRRFYLISVNPSTQAKQSIAGKRKSRKQAN